MVKEGPCYHCGVTSTPLWRNGPLEKPVLCNACGSRWRTKGTLTNYMPMYLRGEPEKFVDQYVARNNSLPVSRNKEVMLPKRKQLDENEVVLGITPDNSQSFSKVTLSDDDLSNRSSSGSAISNSDSCAQFNSADASDLTGPAQSVILAVQEKDAHYSLEAICCRETHQGLVYYPPTTAVAVLLWIHRRGPALGMQYSDEMGHGSALIIHPGSIGPEEESETSSLSINNKRRKINDVDSRALTPVVHSKDSKPSTFPRV